MTQQKGQTLIWFALSKIQQIHGSNIVNVKCWFKWYLLYKYFSIYKNYELKQRLEQILDIFY